VIDDLLIVVGEAPGDDQPFRKRLEALTGARIRLVPVDTRSALAIARQLAGGGVVATMLDTCLPHSRPLIAPFLGRPAASPAGIYQLAVRQAATVLPVFTLRRERALEVRLGTPVEAGATEPAIVAAQVNEQIGRQILETPGEWMMWPALLDRWKAAESQIGVCQSA